MGLERSGMGSAQTVSVGGVDIATYVDGEEGRPWIVFSNSLAADSSSWDHQLSLLTKIFASFAMTRAAMAGVPRPRDPTRSSI